VPSPVGGLGTCLQKKKKQFCANNYAILSKFWYFFPILQQKVGGGIIPIPESGGPIPLSPPAPTPMAGVRKDILPVKLRTRTHHLMG